MEKVTDISGDGGVVKTILEEGQGEYPEKGSILTLSFITTLVDGTEIDKKDENDPFVFVLGKKEVVQGLEMAIPTMRKGESAEIKIKPQYAFGEEGNPRIPSNSDIIYKIKILNWETEVDLTVEENKGILKKIIEPGVGKDSPGEDVIVKVNFQSFLSNGVSFEKRENFEFSTSEDECREEGILPAMIKCVQAMNRKEISQFTIAPNYAFGTEGEPTKGVQPDETIKIQIELLDFEKEVLLWALDGDNKIETSEKIKNEGNDLYANGQFKKAIKKYQKVLGAWNYDFEEASDPEKLRKIKISCWLNLAQCYLIAKNFDEVLENCDKVLEHDSINVKALYRRGKAYLELGNIEKAQEDFTKVKDLNPNLPIPEWKLLKQKFAEIDKKDRETYSGMFEKLSLYEDRVVESSKPSSFLERLVLSILEPGVSSEQIYVLHAIFILLIITISFMALMIEKFRIHLAFFLFLATGLYVSIVWFIQATSSIAEKDKTIKKE